MLKLYHFASYDETELDAPSATAARLLWMTLNSNQFDQQGDKTKAAQLEEARQKLAKLMRREQVRQINPQTQQLELIDTYRLKQQGGDLILDGSTAKTVEASWDKLAPNLLVGAANRLRLDEVIAEAREMTEDEYAEYKAAVSHEI